MSDRDRIAEAVVLKLLEQPEAVTVLYAMADGPTKLAAGAYAVADAMLAKRSEHAGEG